MRPIPDSRRTPTSSSHLLTPLLLPPLSRLSLPSLSPVSLSHLSPLSLSRLRTSPTPLPPPSPFPTDELIRQVTINCAERGLLLLRVRDEIRMTIAAYQTLYESSIAFGMRKALMAEQKKAEIEAKIKTLEGDKSELTRQVQELKAKCEAIEKRESERRALDEKNHQEEVALLKEANDRLKASLENLLSTPKK